ncbi:MAG: glycosyltransferase [Oscillospiraceae bacterium]|nr:glycosyltransferase [Oscillospiraceae bacterium]
MIPKKIHYCWFGGKALPNEVKNCIKTWEKYCPDYEIIEWNEKNFDVNTHPFLKKAYESKKWAFVSDYVRLKVVYEEGGIYLDTDVELLKNLDFLLENDFFIGVQQSQKCVTTGLGFGAEKNNQVVFNMLQKYDQIEFNENSFTDIICPKLNNSVFLDLGYEYRDEIVNLAGGIILPPQYMDPLAPGYFNLICEDTISIHRYAASWTSNKNRMKRKLFLLIGQKNVIAVSTFLRKFGLIK